MTTEQADADRDAHEALMARVRRVETGKGRRCGWCPPADAIGPRRATRIDKADRRAAADAAPPAPDYGERLAAGFAIARGDDRGLF